MSRSALTLIGWFAFVIAFAVAVQLGGQALGWSTTTRVVVFAGGYFLARIVTTMRRRSKWMHQASVMEQELQSSEPGPFAEGVTRRFTEGSGTDARAAMIARSARSIAYAIYGDKTQAEAQLVEPASASASTAEAKVFAQTTQAAIALFCDRDPMTAQRLATEAQAGSREEGIAALPRVALELIDAVFAASLCAAKEDSELASQLIQRVLRSSAEPLSRLIATWAAACSERRRGSTGAEHVDFLREVAPYCAPLHRFEPG